MVVKQAIDKLNAQSYPTKLLILGKNDPAQLAAWGIGGPYVDVRFISDRSEFVQELRRSDILLSTIAFKSDYPLQDQTCFPTKTFDYFLAGKPILVIAPGNSYYASYMKDHQCSIAIDSHDVDSISMAIRRLGTDVPHRIKLVEAGESRLQEHLQKSIQPLFLNKLAKQTGFER